MPLDLCPVQHTATPIHVVAVTMRVARNCAPPPQLCLTPGLDLHRIAGKERTKDTGSGGQIYSKAQWKRSVLFTEIGGRVTTAGIGEYDFLTDKQRWSVSLDGRVLTREFDDPKQIFVYNKQ